MNHDEPAFINTMSRTMDAFDVRMSTFGGLKSPNKEKNFDKFISEKRGFIRTSNGFYNNNPYVIVQNELAQKAQKQGPGPAFKTSFDNKYNQRTAYANDDGRYKESLNPHHQQEEVLKMAERAKF